MLPKVDLVLTDPPYGVELDGKRAKQRDGSISDQGESYSFKDTREYVRSVAVPIILLSLSIAKRVVLTPGTRCLEFYPSPDDIGCFYSAAGTGLGKWGFTCMQPILYYGTDPYLENQLGARPNSCGQKYPNDANSTGHPCSKPIRMWRWLVNRTSMPQEIILDPFMGSGTTLRAAKDLGRKAIGIEIEEKYCEIAAKRLAQEVLPLDTKPAMVETQDVLVWNPAMSIRNANC